MTPPNPKEAEVVAMELPPLPEPYACLMKLQGGYESVFTADQYRSGQRAAVVAALAQAAPQAAQQDHAWGIAEQKVFAVFLARFPSESSQGVISLGDAWKAGRAFEASLSDVAMPEQALRKLCDQLDGMKRRLRPTPGTGQNHSYLMHEDVEAYVEEARKALAAQPAEGAEGQPA